jgi:uncharacterized RDD family membrane protein YckC
MERNPYAAPTAVVADQAHVPEDDDLASRLQRFLNYLIDLVAQFLVGVVVGVAAQLSGAVWFLALSPITSLLVNLLLAAAYFLFCESVFGRTAGKLITRTRVVSVSGETPRFLQILGRTFARFIPFEAFSFFGPLAVGWHDSLSGTRVIRVERN